MKPLCVSGTYVIRMDWFSRSANGKNKTELVAIQKELSSSLPFFKQSEFSVQILFPVVFRVVFAGALKIPLLDQETQVNSLLNTSQQLLIVLGRTI